MYSSFQDLKASEHYNFVALQFKKEKRTNGKISSQLYTTVGLQFSFFLKISKMTQQGRKTKQKTPMKAEIYTCTKSIYTLHSSQTCFQFTTLKLQPDSSCVVVCYCIGHHIHQILKRKKNIFIYIYLRETTLHGQIEPGRFKRIKIILYASLCVYFSYFEPS